MEELDGLNSLECKAGCSSVTWSGVNVLMRVFVKEKLLKNIPNQQPAVKILGHKRLAITKEWVEVVEKV